MVSDSLVRDEPAGGGMAVARVREYGSEHSSGAGKPRQIGCVCSRKLMVAAVQLAHMSCTQRQRSGGAERDEGHVGG